MEKREIEVMWSYYFGMSKVTMIWEEDMEKLHKSKVIKKIYEVIDSDFDEIWYLIRDEKEKSYIIKSKCGNFYAKDIMKKYESEYVFFKVSTEVIKIFDKGLYPVVFKVLEKEYSSFYNDKKNINNAFFNNYYWQSGNKYKAVREYRNKVEFEVFNREDDAIYWCSNYEKTKANIMKNNIRPLNLNEMVFEYKT